MNLVLMPYATLLLSKARPLYPSTSFTVFSTIFRNVSLLFKTCFILYVEVVPDHLRNPLDLCLYLGFIYSCLLKVMLYFRSVVLSLPNGLNRTLVVHNIFTIDLRF